MISSRRKEELLKKDAVYFIHCFREVGAKSKQIWQRGEGAKLWDIDGKEYIDMSSGGAQCCNLGFARKELIDAAHEQMQKLSHIAMAATASLEQPIEYAAELAKVLPGNINHIFYANSGTEASEISIRTAKYYWNILGKAGKYKVVCLTNALHGGASHFAASTFGAASCRNYCGPESLGIIRIPDYYCHRCQFGLKYPDCGIRCAYFLEQAIETEGEDSIAAFIAEPIQGWAGIIWPPDEYWPIVRKICTDHNIVLITDCIQNGFCRSGKFWGVDNWNIIPDIMVLGKGINGAYLPIGVGAVSDEIYEALLGRNFVPGGGTHSANAVVVATARAALKIYIEERLAQRSAKLGEHIRDRLVNEFSPLPCVDDIMGRGCYYSFEVSLGKTTGHTVAPEEQAKAAGSIFEQFLEKGVVARVQKGPRVAITPPLIIPKDELDAGLDAMLQVMRDVKPV
jgi:putrescine aminotransferase